MAIPEKVVGDGREESVTNPVRRHTRGDQTSYESLGFVLLLVVDKSRVGGKGVLQTAIDLDRIDCFGPGTERTTYLGL